MEARKPNTGMHVVQCACARLETAAFSDSYLPLRPKRKGAKKLNRSKAESFEREIASGLGVVASLRLIRPAVAAEPL
jgi:hypothetical protein